MRPISSTTKKPFPLPPKFRFFADENIRIEVVQFLQETHDVVIVPKGIKNGNVIRLASAEKRILITRDRDFTNIVMYPPAKTSGIIWLHIHPPTIPDMVNAIRRLTQTFRPEKISGKLIILERDRCFSRA